MRYPIDKYQIVVHQHPDYHTTEILARSTYAGETVKGKAICHLNDEYSEEKGTALAVARCNEKIARKRLARATKKIKEAERAYQKEIAWYNRMVDYYNDSAQAAKDAQNEVARLEATM